MAKESKRLSKANEELKIKIHLLRNTDNFLTTLDDVAKKAEFEEYVNIEEENKYAFLSDLDRFRAEYKELVEENR